MVRVNGGELLGGRRPLYAIYPGVKIIQGLESIITSDIARSPMTKWPPILSQPRFNRSELFIQVLT